MKTTKTLFGILAISLILGLGASAQEYSLCTTNGAYVVVPYSASLDITNALTVECWFNRQVLPSVYEDGDTWNSLVSTEPYSTTFAGWDLRFANLDPQGDINLNPQLVYDYDIYANVGNGLLPNPTTYQWHHYAMQYDGTNYFVWIDGSLFFATNCTAQINYTENPIYIGCQNSGWRPFVGYIAEVRVSNIGRYYHSFIPQTRFVTDSNTIALYHFDEGQGTTVADSSSNGNNGTIQGSDAWSTEVPNFPHVCLIKAVEPSFSYLAVGTNYQLQVSGDLNTWTNQGSAFTATNSSMVYPQYFDVANWNQLFFRLQVSP